MTRCDKAFGQYALVLRGQSIRLLPFSEARENELLGWCKEGDRQWTMVAHVVLRRVGSKDGEDQ